MTDPNAFDKALTDLALLRLAGDDRYLVLEAASKLRRYREEAVKAIASLKMI